MSRFHSIWLSMVPCLLLPALSGCILAGRSSDIQVGTAFLSGNQLRLLVRSEQSSSPFYSHSEKIYNVRHYYVGIDLDSKAPLRDAATIAGPLWIEKDREWQKEFVPTWHATTQAHFEEDGQLSRIDWDEAHTNWSRQRLSLEPGKAKWVEAGTVTPIPAPKVESINRLRTPSGSWVVYLDENGADGLYETASGRKVGDAWLEQTVSRLCQLTNFLDEYVHFTDDLKFVIYWPGRSFVWDGQTYNLTERPYSNSVQRTQDHAISFERSAPDGVVFNKGDWTNAKYEDGRWIPAKYLLQPRGWVSIGGDLLFLTVTTNSVALINRQGEARFAAAAPGMHPRLYAYQHDAARGKIMFFEGDLIPRPFTVRIWDYEKGTVTSREINLYSLFADSVAGLEPVKLIKPEPAGKQSK